MNQISKITKTVWKVNDREYDTIEAVEYARKTLVHKLDRYCDENQDAPLFDILVLLRDNNITTKKAVQELITYTAENKVT